MSFHVDGAEWPCGTQVLTGTAADTLRLVHGGDHHRHLIIGIKRFHLNGTGRTVAFAVAAFHPVGNGNTIFLDPDGMSDLRTRLLLQGNRFNSPCRTNLRTAVTLRSAIPPFIAHRGLHQGEQTR